MSVDSNAAKRDPALSPARAPQGAPVPYERRDEDRYMTVLQVGKIVTDSAQTLCLVRNLSAGGLNAHVPFPIAVGSAVGVEFRSSHLLPATVAWRGDDTVGIQFAEPIDVRKALAAQRGEVTGPFLPRGVRLDVFGTGTVECNGVVQDVELFDVSQTGAKISAGGCRQGEKVVLTVDGLPPRSGEVRWREHGQAGIAFNLALPYELLAAWALTQQPRFTLGTLLSGPINAH